jgi:cobalt-zinc-cadmium efflux system protein
MAVHQHRHHHHHGHGPSDRGGGALKVALAITVLVCTLETVGGILSGSLALLADAGHVFADAGSIGLALWAASMAQRPASGQRTFGFKRAEILAALANGIVLGVIAVGIAVAAVGRLSSPPHVEARLTLAVAAVGFALNLTSTSVLARAGGGLNVRAAMRHVAADALSQVGVMVAAVVVLTTGWRAADSVAGLTIAVLVLVSAVAIVRESVDVLMEAAPLDIDVERLGTTMAAVEGVVEVHDLHVWTVTSGFPAVAAHVTVRGDAEPSMVRRQMSEMLRDAFGIEHSTLQVERSGQESDLLRLERHLPRRRGQRGLTPDGAGHSDAPEGV